MIAQIALVATTMLAGCTHFSFDAAERGLVDREYQYNAALRTLTDRSTRADLEHLFPCTRPSSFSPAVLSVDGVFILPPEKHPVDQDFVVSVTYIYSRETFELTHNSHLEKATYHQQIERPEKAIDASLFGGHFTILVSPSASDYIVNLPLRVERRHLPD